MRNRGRLFLRLAIAGAALLLVLLIVVPRLLPARRSGAFVTQSSPIVGEKSPIASHTISAQNITVPAFQHVFLIVMENNSYNTILGNADAPWINSAVRTYIVASHYYAVGHPSEPNYLALTSGSTQGVSSDADVTLNVPNLVDQLEQHGRTWKAYMQGLLADGNTDKLATTAGNYVRKHNPFVSYADIQQKPARMARIVDFSQFAGDLAGNTVPDFAWITPDLCHDMHGAGSCSDPRELIQAGDAFLSTTVKQIMQSPAWGSNSAIFVTWDESERGDTSGCCNADPGGGHIVTLIIPHDLSSPRTLSAAYNHYSLLSTIENAWGLGCLGNACDTTHVQPMGGIP